MHLVTKRRHVGKVKSKLDARKQASYSLRAPRDVMKPGPWRRAWQASERRFGMDGKAEQTMLYYIYKYLHIHRTFPNMPRDAPQYRAIEHPRTVVNGAPARVQQIRS
jgi:hypothetical protein